MNNIVWYSTNKDLSEQEEEKIANFNQAEKVIESYVEKWKNIGKYTASEEYKNGDGMDILSQTSFFFLSNDGSKLDINMGEKYQINFEMKKYNSLFFSWLKYKKKYETNDISKLKNIVRNFFELDCKLFKDYFNF